MKSIRSFETPFDLVITDMNMPHVIGMQLSEQLTATRYDIPVIISTGFSKRINKEKAAAIGIKGFLMKPVIRSKLAAIVRQVLDGADLFYNIKIQNLIWSIG
jgi:two-component system, cell cycle sensor histidine kinase and response regulator CckA